MEEIAGPAGQLAAAIDGALPRWVEQCVDKRYRAWAGAPPQPVMDAARAAGDAARDDVGTRVRVLLDADIDEQWTTPLALLREAVPYPTRVLADAGVPPVWRDRFAQERFPDDPYDLSPAAFSDVGPEVAEPAIAWGAAKAWAHRRRHAS